MSTTRWSGARVTRARAYCRQLLPCACWRCGLPIPPLPESGWVAGHVIARKDGGTDDYSNLRPEHRRCSDTSGGRVAAAMLNARRTSAVIEKDALGW